MKPEQEVALDLLHTNSISDLKSKVVVSEAKICEIPIGLIRPFADQPRKYFNKDGLIALMESMKAVGQKRPIWVRPIIDGQYCFELIDGERRYRSCLLGNIPTILAYVMDVKSKEEQFICSVVANFGSELHTPLEITFALAYIRDFLMRQEKIENSAAIEKVAIIVAHSKSWVYQYLGFTRLCQTVQDFMNERKISFQIGVALSNFTPEAQIEKASYIIEHKLPLRKALHYIRSNRTAESLAGTSKNRRSPSKDYEILMRVINRLRTDTETILDMKQQEVERIFKERSTKEMQSIVMILQDAEEDLNLLRRAIAGIIQEKSKKKPES
ncbi:MAG: ParB/RepB/Spo0J family partition protein [Candidatus Paceibacterota bacterium]|jgi:ParB family chromosome partitioning protein